MHVDVEHSPALWKASNHDVWRTWSRLAGACRAAASPLQAPLDEILRQAAASCGAERAFLVRARHGPQGEPFGIVAVSTTRPDGNRKPSRSVVRRAFAAPRPALTLGIGTVLEAGAASVRSLGLRATWWAPVPLPPPDRAAIVLDSRDGFRLPAAGLREALDAFTALVALAWRTSPREGLSPSHVEGPALSKAEGPALSNVEGASVSDTDPSAASHDSPHQAMMAWVRRIAPTVLPVLVQGESGSGKENVARALHRHGPRQAGPFVAINCMAVTESLLEAELFGAVRGAYTGADRDRPGLFRQADGGTLFLDEVGDMPGSMQAKLLRVLDAGRVRPVGGVTENAVDVRIVAATHRDLQRRVDEGLFRADLFYRLAVLRVDVPPLRARLDDLVALVDSLAPRLSHETGCAAVRLTPDAWAALRSHRWPGNVRELHAALARALLRTRGDEIRAAHLDLPAARETPVPVRSLERRMIEDALRATGGSIAHAATRIGWTRQKLYRRMDVLAVHRSGPTQDDSRSSGTMSSDNSTFQ